MDQDVTVNPAAHLEDELWDSCERNDAIEDGDGDDDGYDDYIQQLTEASCTPKTVPPNPDREPWNLALDPFLHAASKKICITFLARLAFSVLHGKKKHIECRGVAQRVHVAIA